MYIYILIFRIKAQLLEANARILSISRDPNNAMSFGDRKSSYHHDLQLEELRNLQVRHKKYHLTKEFLKY